VRFDKLVQAATRQEETTPFLLSFLSCRCPKDNGGAACCRVFILPAAYPSIAAAIYNLPKAERTL
jgi:hypothetical protein